MTAYPRASIPATEVRTIKSKYVRQDFRISVALPHTYPHASRKKYPTVYLLDANWYFGMVTDLARVMRINERFPECIVVGIGYPVDEPLEAAGDSVRVLRLRDMSPVVDREPAGALAKELKLKHVRTGGAKRFLQFIKTELIPRMEADYRIDPARRVLAGHSMGGLFVLYALFQEPKLFMGYVAGSPSLWFGDGVTFKYEQRFARTHRSLNAKLYLGVGQKEEDPKRAMVSNMIRFATRLKSRGYKGLSVVEQVMGSYDHVAFTAPTFSAGLTAVLT